MTQTQVLRAYRKLWDKVTEHDGYQPFGYDLTTLSITKPAYMRARKRLQNIYRRADK